MTRTHIAALLLLTLLGLHLVLGAVEVFYRPIFPWDAWLNWMYRAKAWYLSGAITDFDAVALWSEGAEPANTYAVAGHDYPRLLPLVAFSVALLLGAWSETLVNLPTLALGGLLAAATYMVARRHGMAAFPALCVAYLVLSTPLVGAHLSLAGQADIWMTATTGVGFALLCSALTRQHKRDLLTALLLIMLGCFVKREGIIWLAIAAALTCFGLRPRATLLAASAGVLGIVLLLSLGFSSLHLPLIGLVGVADGQFHLPVFGSVKIQTLQLGDDYVSSFLLGASWNALWYLVAAAVIAAVFQMATRREAAIHLVFFAFFFAGQIVIFFFTEQGAWAEDWTAINRLPMHFAPALLFSCICVLWPHPAAHGDKTGGRGFAGAVSSSGVSHILLTCLIGFSAAAAIGLAAINLGGNGENPDTRRTIRGQDFNAISGTWSPYADGLALQRYEENIALLSTGPVTIVAKDTPIIRILTSGTNRGEFTLFWRSGTTGSLHNATVAGLGDLYLDMTGNAEWQGVITELGFVFYDDGGSVKVQRIEGLPASLTTRLRQFVADRRWVAPWSQKSVHWLPGGNPDAYLPMLALALAMFTLSSAILFLFNTQQSKGEVFLGACLASWVLFDSSWLYQRSMLAAETTRNFEAGSSEALNFGNDKISRQLTRLALCDLVADWNRRSTAPLQRLVIASDSDSDMRFEVLRAKYHALPAAAHAHETTLDRLPTEIGSRILVLKLRYGRASANTWSSEEAARLLSGKFNKPVRVAWETRDGFMLVADPVSPEQACWQSVGVASGLR
jgi:hypothetical protein